MIISNQSQGWLSLYSVCWLWRKIAQFAEGRIGWKKEFPPRVSGFRKRRGFKPSKMTDHKMEQMKER